ncbi:MAG TPA: hypothetical protein EYH07_17740, partial [Kiloniellaceae bacterium]|nr:hypothetical protein [Kiloniellaceae bacterium]
MSLLPLRFAAVLLACASLMTAKAGAQEGTESKPPQEPPALRFALATDALPPLAERLPAEPRRDLPAREGWQ